MMLAFYTKDPAGLLQKFKAKLNAKIGQDSIQTWEQVGEHFGHTGERWKGKMSFKVAISDPESSPRLIFSLASLKKGTKEEKQIAFAYYHGHLLQTFIDHLSDHFTAVVYKDVRSK